MGFWSSLPRLRSCSRRFVYSTSRRSRSTEFGTTEAGVTSHVFPSNSSRLRNPIFLSLLGISAGTVALQSQPSLAFCSFLYNDTKTAMLENEGMQTNDSCSDFGDFLEQFLDVSVPDFLSNNDLILQYPSNEYGQDTAAYPTNEDSNEGNEQKTAFETKQGRPKTSVVWTAFEKVFAKDGTVTKVKCKSCPAVFRPSKSSSTTHLRRHMNNCCTNNIASKNKQKVDQIEAAKPANGATQINNNHELNVDDIRDTACRPPLGISSGALAPQSQPSTSFCHNNPNREDQYQLDTNVAEPANGATQINNNYELNIDDIRDICPSLLSWSLPLGTSSGALAPQSQPSTSFCHNNPNREDQYQLDTNAAKPANGATQTNGSCSDFSDFREQFLDVLVPDTGFLGSGGMQNKDSYDQGNDIPNTNTGFERYGYPNGQLPWNEADQDTGLLANGGRWTNHSNDLDTDTPNSDFSCNDDLIQQYPSNEDGQDTAASPNEDSNEGNAQKTAFETKQGRPKTSVVWIAFEKVFDKGGTVTEVKCKSCPAVFLPSKSSSTTHLLRHMNNCCTNNIASKNKRKVDQIKMDSPLGTPSLDSTSCHLSSHLNTLVTPIEIEDVKTSAAGSMPVCGHGRGGQPLLPRKKRNVSNKSAVLDHLTRDKSTLDDDPVAHCNYYGTLYKCHPKINGTSSMMYHENSCQNYKSLKSKQDRSQSKFTFGAGQGGSSNNLMITKCSENIIRKTLCEMIIVDEMPFMTVEGKGFQKLLKVLEPRFKVPSQYIVMKDCVKLYMIDKNILKNMFFTTGQRICLTTDTWTSIQNMNYMCITGHFIDTNWKYHRMILAFRHAADNNGKTIANVLEDCLVEWGIHRILTISVDNASANDAAIDWFKKRNMANKEVVCRHEFIHVRCSAQILNLIVHEGLKNVDNLIIKIRNMVTYVNSSTQKLDLFKSCAERKNVECNAFLTLDVPTRWNSTYTMLEEAEKYQMAFELMIEEDEHFLNYLYEDGVGIRGLGSLTDDDWCNIHHLIKFLQVFYDVTMQIYGSLHSTSNSYFDVLCSVYSCLTEYSESSDPFLNTIANIMKVKYDKYWGDVEKINPLLFVASLLDPRYKMAGLEYWFRLSFGAEKAERMDIQLKCVLNRLYEHYTCGSKNVGSGSILSNDEVRSGTTLAGSSRSRTTFLQNFHSFRASRNLMQCKTEIEQYFLEDVEAPSENFDILMWWKVNLTKFPILAEIARDILAIPITTVASGSAFSTGGRVIDPYRSSLTPKTVEALVCIQNWLRSSPISAHESYLSNIEDEESYKFDSD